MLAISDKLLLQQRLEQDCKFYSEIKGQPYTSVEETLKTIKEEMTLMTEIVESRSR